MLSLLRTFTYEGDLSKSGYKKVKVQIKLPRFTYAHSNLDPGVPVVTRQTEAWDSINFPQVLDQPLYHADLPVQNIIGRDPKTNQDFISYTLQPFDSAAPAVNDLLLNADVKYVFEGAGAIGGKQLNALYFVKNINQLKGSVPAAGITAAPGPVDVPSFLSKNIFLINKDVYDNVNPVFKSISKTTSDFKLLNFIKRFVEISDIDPVLIQKVDDVLAGKLVEATRELDLSNPQELVGLVRNNFTPLFDFPISVPVLKTVKAGGTFALISTIETGAATKADLSLYSLSLEYLLHTSGNNPALEIHHIDWALNKNEFKDNRIGFSFPDGKPILANNIDGDISVIVQSFDGAVVWSQDLDPEDAGLENLSIEVPLVRPVTLHHGDKKAGKDGNKKLRGQILELTKKCPLKDITVLIRAQKAGNPAWHIVGAGNTDNSGNFSIPYPFGIFTAAQAIVSLTPDSPADIPVHAHKNNQSIADDFLYLLVKEADCTEPEKKDDDCDCHSKKKASRLPDQKDLINSDEYTQDIGGSCLNLSTPNRTLREYNYNAIVRTSDPDVANYTLKKLNDGSFELTGDNKKIKRSSVDLTNPVRWQDAPDFNQNLSVYQSVTVATGHVLYYKSEFKADGYSLGELLYSLALAPGQKKEIVVLDSSHTLQAAESQTLSQGERLAAGIVDDREITDQLGGSINEAMRGKSSASTSGISAGLGIGASMGAVGASLGVSGGYSNSNSSASQNSSRNVSQFFGEKLRQSIMQNADSYRQMNASVVTTVKEGQSYSATTDVVANHNHCHALTMMYFEVLRHYAIYQELTNVEECVFVPLLMTNFTTDNIYKWFDVLARTLLPMHSNTYLQPFSFLNAGRQHPLLKAFDANERIKTNYALVDFPVSTYDDEQISFIKGDITIRTELARPKTRYDRIKSLPVTSKTVSHEEYDKSTEVRSVAAAVLTGGLSFLFDGANNTKTVTEQVLIRAAIFDLFMELDANYQKVPPAQCMRVTNFQPTSFSVPGIGTVPVSGADFFENGYIDKQLWTVYASILGYNNVYDMLDYYFKGRLISEWDEIFNQDVAPIVFERIADSIKIDFLAIDATVTSKYKGGERVMQLHLNGTTNQKRNQFPLILKLFSVSPVIRSLKGLVTLTIQNVKIFYSTAHYNGILFSGYVGDDLLDGTNLFIPENTDEKKNPRKEDTYLVNKLIGHLNSNLEHYNKMLWFNLDADRRYAAGWFYDTGVQ